MEEDKKEINYSVKIFDDLYGISLSENLKTLKLFLKDVLPHCPDREMQFPVQILL